MPAEPRPPAPETAKELQRVVQAERAGNALLLLRRDSGELEIVVLDAERDVLTIGRGPANAVSLPWDGEVSRTHAVLEHVGDDWVLADDGLSRNGTFVAGERVGGRRRLQPGDAIRVGRTVMVLRGPTAVRLASTMASAEGTPVQLTPAQHRIVTALCRPVLDGRLTPATNQEIADELVLSVDAVKTHLQAVFGKFGLAGVAQGEKRARVVERALREGIVGAR